MNQKLLEESASSLLLIKRSVAFWTSISHIGKIRICLPRPSLSLTIAHSLPYWCCKESKDRTHFLSTSGNQWWSTYMGSNILIGMALRALWHIIHDDILFYLSSTCYSMSLKTLLIEPFDSHHPIIQFSSPL